MGKIIVFPTEKCALKGCQHQREHDEIWCSIHVDEGPGASCDNLPAIPELEAALIDAVLNHVK
jgi:hypothetical protein